MPERAAHLRVVDQETGELHETCPNCAALEAEKQALETEKRSWRVKWQNLKRDKDQEAKDDPLWPQVARLFRYWQMCCEHPRSVFTADRFYLAAPFVKEHGEEFCQLAVDGASFDPYKTKRRNGTIKRFDDWELVFRDRGHFEEFCNKAPRNANGAQT